ncbi:hypothetical protein QMK38_01140 [Lysinibacillus fusiformis]|nr:hypothetical protein [Lysinibacillus fusiformis]
MTLREVLERLNDGKTVSEIAKMINKTEDVLKSKLKSAAIVYDFSEEQWKYIGGNAEKSLSRLTTNKIKLLEIDKAYVENEDRNNETTVLCDNMEYKLFKDYLNIDHSLLNEKKTFYLSDDLYTVLKRTSKEKSFKINALLNVLIKKGMEYYKIK